MKRQNIKVILMEPYFDQKTPNSIASQTGAKVLVVPPSVGGEKSVTDYIKLFDFDVNMLVTALKDVGAKGTGN
jgi:ABC-type Zn uptake system ZnuABC Zn-binding protein ZnuA